MNDRNIIRNMEDLLRETKRVRNLIVSKERDLAGDYRQVIDAITPMRFITGVVSKLITTAPAIYSAYSIFRTVFGRKSKSD